jgi:hypothetical protein
MPTPSAVVLPVLAAAGRVPRARPPAIPPRHVPITVIAIASRPGSTPPTRHVFRTNKARRNDVPQHRLLQWSQGVAGENQTVVVLDQVVRLFNQQLFGSRKEPEVVCPRHHMEAPKILLARRGCAETLDPCRRAQDSRGRGLVASVRGDTCEFNVRSVAGLETDRLQLPVPR